MFLWLTSQGTRYGGGNTVLESPVFYTVSTESGGERSLIPYQKNDPLDATLNIIKTSTEEGQATDNVLLDKNENLVYYIMSHVFMPLMNGLQQVKLSKKK